MERLKFTMRHLRAIPTRHHTSQKSFVPPALSSAVHVFIRRNAVKCLLQPPYDGPFFVLKPNPKHYIHHQVQRSTTVYSIDQLNPAFLEDSDLSQLSPSPSTPPTWTTRSGRTVRWPDRLTFSVILCPC